MAESLPRRLGLADAVVVGLTAMIGAGVFSAFAPAAASAGALLPLSLCLAAAVAFLNATASAQLAVQYPTSGGTYFYGRERLGHWWGFAAGWGFVIGKSASAAAMAMTFAVYAVPDPWQRPAAAAAVLAITGINVWGINRTARVARVLLAVVLLALAVAFASGIGTPSHTRAPSAGGDWYGVLQGAGLLFFAFAGYARIATLGEEVREPERNLPRAIVVALGLTLTVYAGLAFALLNGLGTSELAGSAAPLADLVAGGAWPQLGPLIRVGAAAASLGALLALVAGVTRTMLAMARNRDLPAVWARIHPRLHTPMAAELCLGAIVAAITLLVDLRGAIGFSSFGVLLYYAIANASAFTQSREHRRYPRAFQALGLALCLLLMTTLPAQSLGMGVAVVAVGLGVRWLRRARTAS